MSHETEQQQTRSSYWFAQRTEAKWDIGKGDDVIATAYDRDAAQLIYRLLSAEENRT